MDRFRRFYDWNGYTVNLIPDVGDFLVMEGSSILKSVVTEELGSRTLIS